jgi:hypothetical protein
MSERVLHERVEQKRGGRVRLHALLVDSFIPGAHRGYSPWDHGASGRESCHNRRGPTLATRQIGGHIAEAERSSGGRISQRNGLLPKCSYRQEWASS